MPRVVYASRLQKAKLKPLLLKTFCEIITKDDWGWAEPSAVAENK